MDTLEFLAKSEWPLVAFTAIWIVRRPLRAMLDRANVTKIDAWGLKAEFEKGLDKIDALTPPEVKEASQARRATLEPWRYYNNFQRERSALGLPVREAGYQSPERTVLQAWARLQSTAEQMAEERIGNERVATKHFVSMTRVIDALELPPDEKESFFVLRDLRNHVAHSTNMPITIEDATRFEDAVERLLLHMYERQAMFRANKDK